MSLAGMRLWCRRTLLQDVLCQVLVGSGYCTGRRDNVRRMTRLQERGGLRVHHSTYRHGVYTPPQG